MGYSYWDEHCLHKQRDNLNDIAHEYSALNNRLGACLETLAEWDSAAANRWKFLCTHIMEQNTARIQELYGISGDISAFTANHHFLLEEVIEWITGKVD